MTPVPFDLPLRPAEAATIAAILFEHAEGKALTDDLRNRLAARAAGTQFESMTPHFPSLEKDPTHPSAFYLAVDAQDGEHMLLHLALASAPVTAVFPKALLIGRMRAAMGREVVVNAVPFGPGDYENLRRFARQINPVFQPKPQSARATLAVEPQNPAADLSEAFALFRSLYKRTGLNTAAVAARGNFAEIYHAAVWAAIRCGWREGYTIGARVASEQDVEATSAYTRFTLEDAARAPELLGHIRRARAGRSCEIEVLMEGMRDGEMFTAAIELLREEGCYPQLLGVDIEAVETFAPLVRQYQTILSLRPTAGVTGEALDAASRCAAGRIAATVPVEMLTRAAEHLIA